MSLNHDHICNNDTSTNASIFLKLTTSFDFIVSLVIASSVIDRNLLVTPLLQSKTADVLNGLHLISSLKPLGHSVNVDYSHDVWYKEALLKLSLEHVEDNVLGQTVADSVSDYYKCSISIHFLDYLNNELQQRLDTLNMTMYKGLAIVPSKLIGSLNRGSKLYWKEKFLCFANFYKDDMPNYIAIPDELDLWEQYWKTFKGDHPNNVSATLKTLIFPGF